MHCNPMHTPNKGISGPSSRTVCNEIPESCGAPFKKKKKKKIIIFNIMNINFYTNTHNCNCEVTWSRRYEDSSRIFPIKQNNT